MLTYASVAQVSVSLSQIHFHLQPVQPVKHTHTNQQHLQQTNTLHALSAAHHPDPTHLHSGAHFTCFAGAALLAQKYKY
jgi:hypothetical protein